MKYYGSFFLFCFMITAYGSSHAEAAIRIDTIFVAQNIGKWTETYDKSTGKPDGGAYKATNALQIALDSMRVGCHIVLRGGRHRGAFEISSNKNGSSWEPGNYNLLTSYYDAGNDGMEWAVLDGNDSAVNSSGSVCTIGFPNTDATFKLCYWKFERIEITGGGNTKVPGVGNGTASACAAGFYGNVGPFIFRYCYIHDNIAHTENNNPGGLKGVQWSDCLVEYCYFKNNGTTDKSLNSSHLQLYSDYKHHTRKLTGYNDDGGTRRNEIRYNYFGQGSIGYKNKAPQLFCGRNPSQGHGLNDTYNDYGDNVHHNIFKKLQWSGIQAHQDFIQIHHNIIDSCDAAISVGVSDEFESYKVTVYNNTVKNTPHRSIGFDHCAADEVWPRDTNFYAYVYNNIIDSGTWSDTWNKEEIVCWRNSNFTSAVFDSFIADRNYIYNSPKHAADPTGEYVLFIGNGGVSPSRYTAADYRKSFSPRIVYANWPKSGNLLYGKSYKTLGTHVVAGDTTIANGGIGGRHPYLDSITGTGDTVPVVFPKYIGATDPSNNDWVDKVVELADLGFKTTPVVWNKRCASCSGSVFRVIGHGFFSPRLLLESGTLLEIYDLKGRRLQEMKTGRSGIIDSKKFNVGKGLLILKIKGCGTNHGSL